MARVFIGIPLHSGTMSAMTMTSVFVGSSGNHEVQFMPLGLSLLAKNFNLLFINAMKRGFDYFILHHSDLGVLGVQSSPGMSWVDALIKKTEDHDAAAVSAVVPIKSEQGLTSTGIELDESDPFSLRRMTVLETNEMPLDVIEREDLVEHWGIDEHRDPAGAFLINSGVLCMPLKHKRYNWADVRWPGFQIIDQVVWNRSGVPGSYTIPEDWAFSRFLYNEGWPYYATRDLVVGHVGNHVYTNNGGWGEPHDGPPQQKPVEEYRESW